MTASGDSANNNGGILTGEDQARLLTQVARGDRQAFALLFKHFAPRVKGFLARGGVPVEQAEELAQEAMLTVWRKAAMFDPARAGAATWIYSIARNLRIDQQRRDGRARDPDPSEELDEPSGIEAEMLAAERDQRVRHALAALSDEQATVVRLSFYGEKAHGDIALALGIPLGTVKSRMRLAVAKLRALLDDEQ